MPGLTIEQMIRDERSGGPSAFDTLDMLRELCVGVDDVEIVVRDWSMVAFGKPCELYRLLAAFDEPMNGLLFGVDAATHLSVSEDCVCWSFS